MAEHPHVSDLLGRIVCGYPARMRKTALEVEATGGEPDFELRVAPPVTVTGGLPTFDARTTRPLTPMLRARYAFASSMTLGYQVWLTPLAMSKAMRDPGVRDIHLGLREHGEGTAPNLYPDSALSLFSYAPDSPDELVYLVWTSQAG